MFYGVPPEVVGEELVDGGGLAIVLEGFALVATSAASVLSRKAAGPP